MEEPSPVHRVLLHLQRVKSILTRQARTIWYQRCIFCTHYVIIFIYLWTEIYYHEYDSFSFSPDSTRRRVSFNQIPIHAHISFPVEFFHTKISKQRHYLKHGWAHQIKCKHFLFPAPKKIQDILLYCQRFSSLALCWLVRAQPAHSRYTDLCRKKRPKHRRMLGSPLPQKK